MSGHAGPAPETTEAQIRTRDAAMVHPKWAALFFVGGAAVLIPLGLTVRMLLGLSAASDRVFALEAFVAGWAVTLFVRKRFDRRLVVARNLRIPFVWVWLLLCGYVFLFTPFE